MPITLANTPLPRLDWHRHASGALQASASRSVSASAPPCATDRDLARRPTGMPSPTCDAEFVALQAGYRPHGGLVRAGSLAACLDAAGAGGYVELARRIVAGQLFSFQWHDDAWVPLFQLDRSTPALREAPRRVLTELQGVYDGWGLARWHLRPHAALGGQCPLDLLADALPAVLAAARGDRARAAARA